MRRWQDGLAGGGAWDRQGEAPRDGDGGRLPLARGRPPEPGAGAPAELFAADDWLGLSRPLAGWLDSSFQVPGTRLRFGWEAVIGLIPGVGDAVGAALSGVLLWTAHRLGVPRIVQARMLVNVMLDTVIGAVPLVGDLYDFFFRSNRRNLALLDRALAEPGRRGRPGDWAYVIAVAVGAGAAALALAGLALSAGVALLGVQL
jgi:hypothetical protein